MTLNPGNGGEGHTMNTSGKLYVRFERGRDDVEGPTFGPYPFVQVTYDELRVGPDGETLAVLDREGDWVLTDMAREYAGAYFSDFVIASEVI